MRKKLGKMRDKQNVFIGRFVKYGYRHEDYHFGKPTTILIEKLVEYNSLKIVSDHVWITIKKNPKLVNMCNLCKGDYIIFTGTISSYEKGYKGKNIELIFSNPKEMDYEIINMKNIKVIHERVLL